MAARLPKAASVAVAAEVHHRIPRCLLDAHDRGHGPVETGGDIQDWLDWEEAHRYGVDPDVTRDELAALIEGSTVEIPRAGHRAEHAGDFERWGRRSGLSTLARYGSGWFALLARRWWEKVTADELAEALAGADGGRG